jgi:alpha-beta hydrolase superfamily lysophospholipase
MAMVNSENRPIIEDITFLVDNYVLKGTLHRPPVSRPPLVVGSHGLFSDRTSPKQIRLADECNLNNIAYFRFDHRGCGDSEGSFEEVTSLGGRCTDLICAVELMKTRDDIANRIGLFGSSMGGAVCLSVAKKLAVETIVTVAAPIRSEDIIKRQQQTQDPSHAFKMKKFDIFDDLKGIHNILIFHGEADETVPLLHANQIYDQTSQPKRLIVYPNGDHRMSNTAHQKDFIRKATAWFKTYLAKIC